MDIKPIETQYTAIETQYKGYRFHSILPIQPLCDIIQPILIKEGYMPNRWGFIDRVGERYGRLTVIEFAGVTGKDKTRLWKCRCDCGNECVVKYPHLSAGHTKSCGCLFKETRTKGGWNILEEGESAFNQLFYAYKKSARERGHDFDLTKDDFRVITSQPCYYCGSDPTMKFRAATGTNGSFYGNGIDRIDNNLGYIEGNVRPCCKQCNIAKGVLSEQDFYEWVDRVSAARSARFEHGEKGAWRPNA